MMPGRRTRRPAPVDLADDVADLDDPRVIAAVKQYQAALEAGIAPHPREFLAGHADIAAELSLCLAGLELVHRVAKQMRRDAGDTAVAFSTPILPLPLATR
jgi:hypothetical protein